MTLIHKTAEDKIDGALEEVIRDIEMMLSQKGNKIKDKGGAEYNDLNEWLGYYSVSYEDDLHYRAKRLAISCGGPADGLRFFEDGTIEYYYKGWYDKAARELSGRQYEIAKELYDRCLAEKE
jgi:hypothetical protein